jgi:hypothetical protein
VWYAASAWLEAGVLRFDKLVDPEAIQELSSRQSRIGKGIKVSIETKPDYKLRTGGKSPDLADGALVCLHAMRVSFPETPGIFSEVTIDQLNRSKNGELMKKVSVQPVKFLPPKLSPEWDNNEGLKPEETVLSSAEWWEN